jgi:O-antigen/teichoic acid export membrane protein
LPKFTRKLSADSLFKNSAFLVGNLLLGTACGFGSLTLLTHIFSVQAVGVSTTAISSCVLVESITQFGLSYSLPRFLPSARNRTTLVNTALTTVLLSTVVVSVIFLTLPYARGLFVLGGWLFGALFILAACVLAAETILSTVLVADRASDKLAVASVVPNLLRLAAPPALLVLGNLGSFVSRVTSDSLSCAIFATLVARRGHRFRPQLDFTGAREIVRFSGGMYLAAIVGSLPQLLLPLIVFSRVGVNEAAYWGVAMSVATMLFQLPSMISQALLPEVSRRAAERGHLIRRAALLVTAIMLPALVIAFCFAPIGLAIFSHSYVTGATGPLRWLIIAAFITMLNSVLGAVLLLAKKSLTMTIVNVVNVVVVVGMVLVWAKNVDEIAISWAVGDLFNTALFFFSAFFALREVGWRWEDLGGPQVESAVAPVLSQTASRGLPALDLLVTIAQQQQEAQRYLPRQYPLTDSRGLFTVMAFQAAERQRAESSTRQRPTDDYATAPAPAPQRFRVDPQHAQAFDVLFGMAKRQRDAGLIDPRYPQPRGGQDPYAQE